LADPAGPSVLGAEPRARPRSRTRTGGRAGSFRADRVDAEADRLRVTDYKTGKVPSDAKGEGTRRRKPRQVRQGSALQAVAYLAAARTARARRDRALFSW
jgi:hypothetical protein